MAFNLLIQEHLGLLTGCPSCTIGAGAVGTLLLLGYLSWPWLHRILGGYYLPAALVMAVFLPLFVQGDILHSSIDPRYYGNDVNAWQIFLFLFFPLLLIGWQYSFRAVLLYSLFSGALEIVMLHFTNYTVLFNNDVAYQDVVFLRSCIFLITGYIITRVMAQQRKQRRELVEANRRLSHYAATLEQLATTRERNRMACELHDVLAHTLSGLVVQLEAARLLWQSTPHQSFAILEESLEATRNGLGETRKAIQALRASPLEDLGLLLAIRNLAETAASQVDALLDLDIPQNLDRCPPDMEQCIYRVTQEALENIVRHAEAHRITLQLVDQDGHLILTVADDGQGFDARQVDSRQHFGLKGMQERAEMLGGALKIHSQPGQGTTVRLTLEQAL